MVVAVFAVIFRAVDRARRPESPDQISDLRAGVIPPDRRCSGTRSPLWRWGSRSSKHRR